VAGLNVLGTPGVAAERGILPSQVPQRYRPVFCALLLLFLVSVIVRFAWLQRGPKVIETEGVYYARVGENLAAGIGYVGMREVGLQLLYPPLYPVLIAGGVSCGLSTEFAGRLISLIFGSFLPVVVCLLARRLYGPKAGWLAGLLAVFHPLLIVLSAAVLTESTYLTLSLLGAYFTVGVLSCGSRKDAILSGAFLGLAYLCRPEAMILAAIVAVMFLGTRFLHFRLAVEQTAWFLSALLVFALPYIAFLTVQTGQLRFEAKTPDALAYALRRSAGQDPMQIYFSIDGNLAESGSSIISNLELVKTTHASLEQRVQITLRQAKENLSSLLRALGAPYLGAPFLIVFVSLGLLAMPWSRNRFCCELPLLAIVGLTLATFGTWPFFHDRFIFPLLPPLIVWAGQGLQFLERFARGTSSICGLRDSASSRIGLVALITGISFVCVTSIVGVRNVDEVSLSWSHLQEDVPIGRWLRSVTGGKPRLMDTGPTIAFYAGAILVPYPFTDSTTALRYVNRKQVEFLILRESARSQRPYLEEWNRNMPDARAELVKTFEHGQGDTIRIYRWHGKNNDTTSDLGEVKPLQERRP